MFLKEYHIIRYSIPDQLSYVLNCILGLLWVSVSWIIKLTVVIFGADVSFDGIGNSKESIHVNLVANVGVEVVLEMLEHVHVVVDKVISSNSWEGE